MSRRPRPAAWRFGIDAEALAAWRLRLKGYRILARRFRCPQGEIDLVARRGGTLVFVEVKARARDSGGELITARQRRRIERAAGVFLQRHPALAALDIRFDAVRIEGRGRFHHQPDAWRTGD